MPGFEAKVRVGQPTAPSLSVSPRRKNVHGALANVHEWSPSLLSPSFVEQVARRFVEFIHVQVKFARSTGQASKHTHTERNEVTLVWGSLRLAPIMHACVYHMNERDLTVQSMHEQICRSLLL